MKLSVITIIHFTKNIQFKTKLKMEIKYVRNQTVTLLSYFGIFYIHR